MKIVMLVLNVLDGAGTSFVPWLEIRQRSLPLSYFWVPLAHTHGPIIDTRSLEVFLSSEKLRVILVISKSTEKDNKNLSKIILIDEEQNESGILFSEIVGQRCTYKISETEVEAYGEDMEEYTNFFGEAPKY